VASRVLAQIKVEEYWLKLLRADAEDISKLALDERREIRAVMVYLTDRREGKPPLASFQGDTRESARELDFGNLPMPTSAQPRKTDKPN